MILNGGKNLPETLRIKNMAVFYLFIYSNLPYCYLLNLCSLNYLLSFYFSIKDFLSSSRCKMTGKFSVFVYVSMSILKFFSILHLFSCFIHSIQIMCYFTMKVFFNKVEDRRNKKVKLFWTYCTTNFNFENFYVFLFL